MREKVRLKYLPTLCLLLLMGLAALTLSACSTQPASNLGEAEVVQTGETLGYDLDGFPPYIPHELEGRTDCLVCHRDGELGKTPKTPHPEFTTCRQCHVLENY